MRVVESDLLVSSEEEALDAGPTLVLRAKAGATYCWWEQEQVNVQSRVMPPENESWRVV